jgi:hypothetical protein
MHDANAFPVITYSSPQQAQLVRGTLETHGIACWVTGEQMAATMSMYGAALA